VRVLQRPSREAADLWIIQQAAIMIRFQRDREAAIG
jgi:hypothetical protein